MCHLLNPTMAAWNDGVRTIIRMKAQILRLLNQCASSSPWKHTQKKKLLCLFLVSQWSEWSCLTGPIVVGEIRMFIFYLKPLTDFKPESHSFRQLCLLSKGMSFFSEEDNCSQSFPVEAWLVNVSLSSCVTITPEWSMKENDPTVGGKWGPVSNFTEIIRIMKHWDYNTWSLYNVHFFGE